MWICKDFPWIFAKFLLTAHKPTIRRKYTSAHMHTKTMLQIWLKNSIVLLQLLHIHFLTIFVATSTINCFRFRHFNGMLCTKNYSFSISENQKVEKFSAEIEWNNNINKITHVCMCWWKPMCSAWKQRYNICYWLHLFACMRFFLRTQLRNVSYHLIFMQAKGSFSPGAAVQFACFF